MRLDKFKRRYSSFPRLRHLGWWVLHNCVAHPLLGIAPLKPMFQLHDWTSDRLNLREVERQVEEAEDLLRAQIAAAREARLVQAMEERHGVSDAKCRMSKCEGLALQGKSICARHHPTDPDIVLSISGE